MFLSGMGKGRHIWTQENLEPALSKERTEEIVKCLKTQEPLIDGKILRDELIEGHLRIGTYIASKYGELFPRYSDDLQAEAFLAICEAVDRIHMTKHDFYTRYILRYIHGYIFKYINRQEKIVYVPREKIKSMIKNQQSFVHFEKAEDIEDIEDSRNSREHLIDTFERIVNLANLTCAEHQIILFHITNQTDEEISINLGKTRAMVQLIKKSAITKVKKAYDLDLIKKDSENIFLEKE